MEDAIEFKDNVKVAQRCVKTPRLGKYDAKAVQGIMMQHVMMTWRA